jgi:heptosyltransferase-1
VARPGRGEAGLNKASSHSTELARREFERICLIKPSSLGDVIHALPVLAGLRRRYPRAHLTWLVNRTFAPLVEGHPDLNEVIAFDRGHFTRLWRRPGRLGAFAGFLRQLRRKRFDLVIDLQGLFRSGLFTRATGAPIRIGFRQAREAAHLAYTHRLAPTAENTHAVQRNLQVGNLLGFAKTPAAFDLHVTADERAGIRTLLDANGVDRDSGFLLVFPGARWATKRWSAKHFAATIDRLTAALDRPVVLHGAPDERELCERIADQTQSRPRVLAGQTDLRLLVALVAEAGFVLCQDSAPMHLAAALDRPMLALIGPTNPHRTGPYQRPDTVLRRELPCAPCYLRRIERCPHAHTCLRDLTPDAVVDRILRAVQPVGLVTDT